MLVIIDCHCDALWKMWSQNMTFHNDPRLNVNYQKWKKSPVKVQCFAVFVPDYLPQEVKFAACLQMIDLFYEQVIKPYEDVVLITNQHDLPLLRENQRGAILTLEGVDALGGDLFKLRLFIRLGVRMIGLTWNEANLAADGILEERGAGLTNFGKQVIQLANEQHVWIDVSHLSYQGFFEALKLSHYPMASHSNARTIRDHPRNLDDQQIRRLVEKDGLMGITFVSDFVTSSNTFFYEDLILHIKHFIQLGAEDCISFGSDFDGSDDMLSSLRSIDDYTVLLERLQEHFPTFVIEKLSHRNFIHTFPFNLAR
ncbi:dipeptidase [Gracilibacillus halophilus]|uniref:dipeptidase n=1 Tax=Gracilibacillus halophilus TaxID=470864 RepID=UPI003B838271